MLYRARRNLVKWRGAGCFRIVNHPRDRNTSKRLFHFVFILPKLVHAHPPRPIFVWIVGKKAFKTKAISKILCKKNLVNFWQNPYPSLCNNNYTLFIGVSYSNVDILHIGWPKGTVAFSHIGTTKLLIIKCYSISN